MSKPEPENKKIITALINWGQHKSYCPKYDYFGEERKCACGFDRCLKELGAYYE